MNECTHTCIHMRDTILSVIAHGECGCQVQKQSTTSRCRHLQLAEAQNTECRSQLLTHTTVVSQLGLLTTPGRDADETGGGTEQKTRTEKTKADENHDELLVCCPPPFLNALTLCTSVR